MAKTEYRSAVRSRKLIKEALADLLQEKPLEKITVTDIVNRAEINRGTFYAHYRDVPDVVNHLIQQTFAALAEALVDQSRPVEELPYALLSQVQKILEEDLYFYRKIMTSEAASVMQEQLVSIMIEYMLAHKDEFNTVTESQYELNIRFCAGGLSNLYRDWFSGKLSYSLEEMTRLSGAMIRKIISNP